MGLLAHPIGNVAERLATRRDGLRRHPCAPRVAALSHEHANPERAIRRDDTVYRVLVLDGDVRLDLHTTPRQSGPHEREVRLTDRRGANDALIPSRHAECVLDAP